MKYNSKCSENTITSHHESFNAMDLPLGQNTCMAVLETRHGNIWIEWHTELRRVINAMGKHLRWSLQVLLSHSVPSKTLKLCRKKKSSFSNFDLSFETTSLTLREQRSSKCMKSKYENAHTYFNFAELRDSAVQTTAQRYRQQCIQVSDYRCTEIYVVKCDKDG